jgi:hypothetical protein
MESWRNGKPCRDEMNNVVETPSCPLCGKTHSVQRLFEATTQNILLLDRIENALKTQYKIWHFLAKPFPTPYGRLAGYVSIWPAIFLFTVLGFIVKTSLNIIGYGYNPEHFFTGTVIIFPIFLISYIGIIPRWTVSFLKKTTKLDQPNNLYYCIEDDCVFNANTRKWAKPEQTIKIITS